VTRGPTTLFCVLLQIDVQVTVENVNGHHGSKDVMQFAVCRITLEHVCCWIALTIQSKVDRQKPRNHRQRCLRQKIAEEEIMSSASKQAARVLLVGSGRMGHIRASLLNASARYKLAGVVDSSILRGGALAEQYDVTAYQGLREAVLAQQQQHQLDGVILSSPTPSHKQVIQEAADHNLAVFVEKPVGETADEIASIFQYTEQAGIPLCCSFQRRFDPSYVAATRAVHTNKIGRPVMAQIFFADHPAPPEEFMLTGGNIFMDLAAHDVDYILHTAQRRVESVYAVGTSSTPQLAAAGVHDNATLVLNLSQGMTATLFMSRSSVYGYDQRCEIFGTAGLVSVQNVPEHATVLSTVDGVSKARLQHSFPERFREAFRLELEAFADVLDSRRSRNTSNTGTTPSSSYVWPVSAKQCVDVQRVADAARLSAETGQVVAVENGW